MKNFALVCLICSTVTVFASGDIRTIKMAVFDDSTCFTVKEAVFPAGRNSVSFFDDTVFFRGSFSLKGNDIEFNTKKLPRKNFNPNVYANPNVAFANTDVIVTLKNHSRDGAVISGRLIPVTNDDPYFVSPVISIQDNASKNITYIKVADIASIQAAKADFMNDIKPAVCWTFSRKDAQKARPFIFSYLSPSIEKQNFIELHLTDSDKLSIIHNTVLCNKDQNFDCEELYLVSGSPEIAMRDIASLLCFTDIRRTVVKSYSAPHAALLMTADRTNAPAVSRSADSFFMQSNDLIYRKIGRVSMEKNENRLFRLQSAENIPYRTITEWNIPALRNVYGKVISHSGYNKASNVLIFKNLCPTMLDAAPVTIYADGKLLMQSVLTDNTPVNAERRINLSEADGIECSIEEKEIVSKRVQNVFYNNRRYVKCTVEAVLKVTNFRKIAAPVNIKYNFNGEMIGSSGADGKMTSKNNSTSLLNPASVLDFEFTLDPKEKKEIKVTYTLLTTL